MKKFMNGLKQFTEQVAYEWEMFRLRKFLEKYDQRWRA